MVKYENTLKHNVNNRFTYIPLFEGKGVLRSYLDKK